MSKLTEEFQKDQIQLKNRVDYEKMKLTQHVLTTRPTLTINEVISAVNQLYNNTKETV